VPEKPVSPHRTRTFALTWLSYASYYLTRKNFSVAKKAVADANGLSKQDLAHVDTGYLAAYAVGQFAWGWAADRLGPRRVIAFGMVATAVMSIAFGWSGTLAAFAIVWLVNGLVQATGWSSNVKAMQGVPEPGKRGLVMGFWTTNYVIGGFVAGPIASWFLRHHGVHGAFAGPAVVVALVGMAILLFLPDTEHSVTRVTFSDAERRAARRQVLEAPRVWVLGASYFFMKAARYAFLSWLPFYGQTALGYSNESATNVALSFEGGGALGAILVGRRFPVAIVSLVGLAASLALYGQASHAGVWLNVACLSAVGFFLFGPDAILSGAAAQELGGPAAAATAAGIINGMGSIGPVFGSELWTKFSTSYGWNAAFSLLAGGAILSALTLVPFWNVGRRGAIGEGGA
jgi:sugar phosphate permease